MAGDRRGSVRWRGEQSVALVGVLGILVTLGLDLSKLVHMPRLVVLGLTVLGALVAIAAIAAQLRSDRRRRQRAWERLLDIAPLRSGGLPKMSDVNPYHIGVSLSKYTDEEVRPPYIPRDLDIEIDKALATETFVVIIGDSKAGKSRTAYEAAARRLPDHAMLVPRGDSGALTKLFEPDMGAYLTRRPILLWLDDIDRYFGADGLSLGLLDRLSRYEPPVTILGTISSLRAETTGAVGEPGVPWAVC
jgi:hypothetical protein